MASDTSRFQRTQSPTRVPLNMSRADLDRERERAGEKYVYLLDIAKHLGRTLCGMSERAERLGCRVVRIRRPESGKAALAVSAEDAKRIIESDVKPAATISVAELLSGGKS